LSTAKTQLNDQDLWAYLVTVFGDKVRALVRIRGGEHSQAFAFTLGEREFIARVNKADYGFKKDGYAAAYFSSTQLPIPEVLHLGRMGDQSFVCVTPRAKGRTLDDRLVVVSEALLHSVVKTLGAIHATPVKTGSRYGAFNEVGLATFPAWKAWLLAVESGKWDATCQTTCFERQVFDSLRAQIKQIAPVLPEHRHLVHGDFGMDNALCDGDAITAIIDWSLAKYGDPLYDVAWLNLWWTKVQFAEVYRQSDSLFAQDHDFDDRLRCYTAYTAIHSLGFFAESGQVGKYEWLKTRLKAQNLVSLRA